MKSPNFSCLFKGNFFYYILICIFFFTNYEQSYSQIYPAEQHINDIVWEPYQSPQNTPQYLVPFNDTYTGNKITRVTDESLFNCDCKQLRHRYSKNQPWNADGSKIMTDGWPAKILDGNTYEVLGDVYCGQIWSNVDPDMTFDTTQNRLYKRNIITQNVYDLHIFEGFSTV